MSRSRISKAESNRMTQLESRLGSRTLRTILAGNDKSIMRPERFANIKSGKALLTQREHDLLQTASANADRIGRYKSKGVSLGQREYQINRAIRDVIQSGKQRGARGPRDMEREMKVIRAFRFLGYKGSMKRLGYVKD